MNHITIATGHAAKAAYGSHLGAVVTALIVAAAIVIVFKVIARILRPRKRESASRPSSPYAAPARRR